MVTVVHGMSPEELDEFTDSYVALIEAEMRRILRPVVSSMGEVITAQGSRWGVSVSDLNPFRSRWLQEAVPKLWDSLLGMMADVSDLILTRLSEALGVELPRVPLDALESTYGENSRERLTAIGDLLMEKATEFLSNSLSDPTLTLAQIRRRVLESITETLPRASTIGRTLVTGNLNRSQSESVRSTKLEWYKRWVATDDDRTRITHYDADGDMVPEWDYFMVGGFPMDHPGDVTGPPQEVMNCRCSMDVLLVENGEVILFLFVYLDYSCNYGSILVKTFCAVYGVTRCYNP